ncbi:hypothetical protein SynA1524_01134 [Synechococcus sp. A15-24]|nr:hypothetical protein SynA1524_01134 [Synechococcus sp. A15-24]
MLLSLKSRTVVSIIALTKEDSFHQRSSARDVFRRTGR